MRGRINTKIQINVPSVRSISILANILLFSPNCIGVNAKLKSRFNKKGRHIEKGISPLIVLTIMYPKEMKMRIYNIVHAGPNNQEGGAHLGLLSC